MKTIFTLIIAGLFTFATTAQDKTSATKDQKAPTEKKVTTEKKYWCTQCDHSSTKAGVCPTHKTNMVMEGWYFCSGNEAKAMANPGKCKDGTAMIRMDESYIKKNKMMGEQMQKEEVPVKK